MEFWELLVYSLEFPYSQMEFRALQLNYLSSDSWIEFTQVHNSKSYLNYHPDCSTQSRISAKAMEEPFEERGLKDKLYPTPQCLMKLL